MLITPNTPDTANRTESKLVVFDIDDVTWDGQGRVAERFNIPFESLVEFRILENHSLTYRQRLSINEFYRMPEYYENIKFYDGFADIMELESAGARLQFCSNQFTQEGVDSKVSQILAAVPSVRPEIFHFNIVDGHTTIKKKYPDESFIVIDDNPYSIAKSPAPHNIMPILPWTQTPKAKAMVATKNVYYVPKGDLPAIYSLVRKLLTS